jgi:hypothetical protein
MSPLQVVSIAVRLFALWLCVYAFMTAGSALFRLKEFNDPWAYALVAAIGVATLALAGFLWFFPRTVARGLLPGADAPPAQASSPDTWFAIGCSLLGLWVLTGTIPALIRYLIVIVLAQRSGTPLGDDWHTGAVDDLVEFGLGVWLLLGAKGIRKVVLWLRTAGPN